MGWQAGIEARAARFDAARMGHRPKLTTGCLLELPAHKQDGAASGTRILPAPSVQAPAPQADAPAKSCGWGRPGVHDREEATILMLVQKPVIEVEE